MQQRERDLCRDAHPLKMERPPLKRLCSDSGNESPRKRRLTAAEDGDENRDPGVCEEFSRGSWGSLLRVTEREVKPDTPAIPSVRSRIQMLQETSRRDGAPDIREESLSWMESEQESSGRADAAPEAETPAGCGDAELGEETSGFRCGMEEHPVALGTSSTRRPLHSEDQPPSTETASRLRKERQEELAMVCAVLDRSNPWRAASMRQPQKRVLSPARQDLGRRRRVRTGRGSVKMGPLLDSHSDSSGSECGEPSVGGSDESLDVSDERCVSSIEVRLRRSCDSEPPSSLCEAADRRSPQGVLTDGDGRLTLNSSEIIDRIFAGVLDVSEAAEDHVSEELDLEPLPMSILSPLTKSLDLQAAISPLVSSVVSSLPELLEEPPEISETSANEESHLPYSIDNYRTLRRNIQEEPTAQPRAAVQSHLPKRPSVDLKEQIKLLSKEVTSLQRIIEQSCCALSYCVDAEHGKGTRQEAEAERLLLVSYEKKAALLKELERLRGRRSEESFSCSAGKLRPCRGSVTISGLRLPLKVDYVCSTILDAGRAGHYFLILIRYGAYDVVATPLASASDAQTGDTIIFPTTVTLNDASSDFKIEIEVYSLAQAGSALVLDKRKSLKPKITPKKLLSSRKSSLSSPACSPAVNTPLRASSFLLVGSLTLTLESLGKMKFPLDKVPFLSPLEGNLYLKVQCRSHSDVQRSGFLTMFEDVSGLGAWHRSWCILSGNILSFWAYPDHENCEEPLGRVNLINCTSVKVEAATRESCARPHTLELVTMRPKREDDTDTLVTQCRNMLCFTKSWLSADTKEEKQLWMDSLNQVLLDLRTWKTSPGKEPASRQAQPSPGKEPASRQAQPSPGKEPASRQAQPSPGKEPASRQAQPSPGKEPASRQAQPSPGKEPASRQAQPSPGKEPASRRAQPSPGKEPASRRAQPSPGKEPASRRAQPSPGKEPASRRAQPSPGKEPASRRAQPSPGEVPASRRAQPSPGKVPASRRAQPSPGKEPASRRAQPSPGEVPASRQAQPSPPAEPSAC
ncbi:anillin-like isoform X2 [Rhinoderma darwinii]|uniref:anillin-like isoform X2 n=1 Tax=Rhinoderma darwinii TaxID=43563 RepID=UPI003F68138B